MNDRWMTENKDKYRTFIPEKADQEQSPEYADIDLQVLSFREGLMEPELAEPATKKKQVKIQQDGDLATDI